VRADKLSSNDGFLSTVAQALCVFLYMTLLGFVIGVALYEHWDNIDKLRNALAVKPRCPRWSVFFGR
jgi:hypothetical protein